MAQTKSTARVCGARRSCSIKVPQGECATCNGEDTLISNFYSSEQSEDGDLEDERRYELDLLEIAGISYDWVARFVRSTRSVYVDRPSASLGCSPSILIGDDWDLEFLGFDDRFCTQPPDPPDRGFMVHLAVLQKMRVNPFFNTVSIGGHECFGSGSFSTYSEFLGVYSELSACSECYGQRCELEGVLYYFRGATPY